MLCDRLNGGQFVASCRPVRLCSRGLPSRQIRTGRGDACTVGGGHTPEPIALRLLGLCRLPLGAPQEARALLEQAHRLWLPTTHGTRFHLGIGLQAVARHHDAAALLRTCEALLPGDPAPSINLTTTLLAIGDVAGATRAARKAVLRGPNRPRPTTRWGRPASSPASFRSSVEEVLRRHAGCIDVVYLHRVGNATS